MRNKKYLHVFCVFIILLSSLAAYFIIKQNPIMENSLCKATIKFKLNDSEHNFEYSLFLSLHFTDAEKGSEHIRGMVSKDGKKYTIARTVNFNYQTRKNSSNYEVTINDVQKAGQDNLPENLATQYLSYTLPQKFVFLKIEELNKHLALVSGLQGPVFICNLQ